MPLFNTLIGNRAWGQRWGIFLLFLFVVMPGPAAVQGGDGDGYLAVTGPCGLEFPEDHGAHPGFRTEWWYYTGNLETEAGRPFGFQFTLFRRQILPPGADRGLPDKASDWRARDLFMGHFAVSDVSGGRFHFDERMARGVLGMAGIQGTADGTSLFLNTWRMDITARQHHLRATADRFSIALDATPAKPPVPHGDRGYSRKGTAPERASCYYSFSRLKTRGTITLEGRTHSVTGLSWMDHEYSTAPLEPGIEGWDWFSIQLDNQQEVMVYLLRLPDGTLHPASSGSLVYEDGRGRHLFPANFSVRATGTWKSPHSGATYPAGWRLTIPSENLSLRLTPRLADQELQTPDSTGVTYWEGCIGVAGSAGGTRVSGAGYAELTGYAGKFERPL